jgi:hypothetical protein
MHMPFQPVSMHTIRSSNQRALAAHWNMLSTDRRFPSFAAFQPQPKDHSPEQLIVWDVEDGGEAGGRRFRVRRLGLRAEETLGASMIGKTMDEVVPPSLKTISLDGAHACAASGSALYAIITTVTHGHQVDCERLLLPFGEGDTVEQIVASLQLISFQGPIDRREIRSDFEMRCSVSFAGSINSDWAVRNPGVIATPERPVLQAAPALAPESLAADKPKPSRRKVFKTGKIYFGKSSEVCTVREMSATGASIELADPAHVPDRFRLVLEMESASRSCAAIWRKDRQIGIRFG